MPDSPIVALALLEGIGLVFSPCILPILPILLATTAQSNQARPLKIILGFVISFTVFALLSRHILIILGINYNKIQNLAYFLFMLFGLVMLIPRLEKYFSSATTPLAQKAQQMNTQKQDIWSDYLLGALLGIIWTPCAGPLLAVALLQVIQSSTNWNAFITLFAFSLGAGLPMLLIAYFGRWITSWLAAISHKTELIKRVLGAIILVFSFLGLMNIQWAVFTPSITASKQTFTNKLENGLPVPYPAPEIMGITQWFNTSPLSIKALKGKVVLIDFWTYSCINCLRTLPYLKDWYAKYHENGFVIIGVHAPEFAFEAIPDNVKDAIQDLQIPYPVALDNAYKTWNNYNNHFWPAHYLIDKHGMVVYVHFGEGEYNVTENNLRYLLNLNPTQNSSPENLVYSSEQTPETYLGNLRATNQFNGQTDLPLNYWRLSGNWLIQPEYIESTAKGNSITLHYKAKKVFLVMSTESKRSSTIKIIQDKQAHTLTIKESKLYEIISNSQDVDAEITIEVNEAGVRLFAFTFGD